MRLSKKIFATSNKQPTNLLTSESIDKTDITVLIGDKITAEIVVYCQDKELKTKIINLLKLLK